MFTVMLMLLVLLQFMLDKTTYFGQTMLYALYMLWVALLILLGRALREQLGMAILSTTDRPAAFLI